MSCQRILASLLLLFALLTPSSWAVEFNRIAAIFTQHCVDCHNVNDPDGKLILETYELAMKGGENGRSILPGKASESLLVMMVEGRYEKDGKKVVMPPGRRKKLEAQEIADIRAWIDGGAQPPAEAVATREIVVPKIAPKVQPRRAIHALAFEPKAKLLAIGRNGEVELESVDQQMVARTLKGPAGNVNAVVFSPDGKFIFAAGGHTGLRGEIRQWNVGDGALVRTIEGHTDAIYSLAISPDGQLLASGSYDQKIKIWNVRDGSEARTLFGHNGCVFDLAFRQDGKILASASGDRTVKLWDVGSGERRDTLSQSLKELYAVAFSPDGRRLAAAGVDRRIRVWEISEEARETTNPLLHSKFAHENSVLRLAFSPDGQTLASSAEDRSLKLWNFEKMSERRALELQPDWVAGLTFVLENRGLAAGRLDGTHSYYSTETGGMIPPPKPEITRVEPRGITRGVPTPVKLSGKNLQRAKEVQFGDARMQAKVLGYPEPAANEIWVEVTAAPVMPRGYQNVSIKDGAGSARLYVDDLPQHVGSDFVVPVPVSIWGVHTQSGQRDVYRFEVNGGETLVFDAAARQIGSKADLVLSILDSSGKVLASNNGFDRSGDPLLVHRFAGAGQYQLVVRELVPAASAEHFYRVSIGAFPLVAAVYPPVVARGAHTELELIGFNIPGEAFAAVHATNSGPEMMLRLDPEKYRWRGDLKVAVTDLPLELEWEPNDAPSDATPMPAPGVAAGRLTTRGQSDWFKFEAKAGEVWVIETRAEAYGSPLDTRIEVTDQQGAPIVRTLLQAVRDSAVTFRGIDSVTVDCRVDNWEEMELNQYLYLEGEVVRLFRAPQGPDSGFNFYGVNGRRRTYFDTTATAHANEEPCYIVEAHPPGTKLVPNGLPVFPIHFENDDDADRKLGRDSRVYFTAPKDGAYLVRVTDSRGFGGARHVYSLTVRPAQPDFRITIDGMNPRVGKGSGQRFAVNVDRIDGFEGEIKVALTNIPDGFIVSNPVVIQEGHTSAFGTIYATDQARNPTNSVTLIASAEINGTAVKREAGSLGTIALADSAPLYVTLEPGASGIPEITIAPGGIVPAHLKIRRNGHTELVTFQVENLPHGIIVDNIGLNGVLIPKDQEEREIFFAAARWVPETDRLCYAVSNEAGRQTSQPILVKVRKAGGQVANK